MKPVLPSIAGQARRRVRRLVDRARFGWRFQPLRRPARDADCFITCTGKQDGVGAQALAVMSTILFARSTGIKYVHTPFQKISHNSNGTPHWEEEWEEFFQLGNDELNTDQDRDWGLERVPVQSLLEIRNGTGKRLFAVKHCHEFANLFPDRYAEILEDVRRRYSLSSKQRFPLHQDAARLNVAVHVRRGDVTARGPHASRFTSNEFVASVVKEVLCAAHSKMTPAVHLYSEGDASEFGPLLDLGATLHLGECAFATFHNLVNADVLVMSKSTFSYTAALLSIGVKIFESFKSPRFAHAPLRQWIVAQADGRLDKRLLVGELGRRADARKSYQGPLNLRDEAQMPSNWLLQSTVKRN
jgi:hypothetical protein